MSDYPTPDELDTIYKWPPKDYGNLMEFIRSSWTYERFEKQEVSDGVEYQISTCGWSGNEELIEAMSNNRMFWGMCWKSAERGGHYVFHIPTNLL